ncbi:MAG: hypothetical protein COY66_05715 [Candidatus Kerfeldbacteria bacterium CG_4_10_14_0_8_um_filter_42_10]|uniref:Peptidase S11 D-alanyl-D-alanine carboxypeptidase A N-terminal domain-containing protein n=1 Tax=Candidatus Kerfeldbacteria bacterium CG_4_10_14_0_8_um_filter_42_10 TaxID=2014248 RepID=A0A2M7RGJ8_9BACT|nr:MAG: hypothetical protein COY66_05715 [Candidatus Kerfeldbacteria bacterium CG_4_10_14_0_8_um_filter_42_10]
MKARRFYSVIIGILIGFSLVIHPVRAQNSSVDELAQSATRIRIDQNTIQKGFTVEHANGNIRFAVTPGQVDQEVSIVLKNETVSNAPLPAGKKAISPYFSFGVKGVDHNPVMVEKPYWVALRYTSDNATATKALYHWDSNKNSWLKMPSSLNSAAQEVRAVSHLPFSWVVVLEDINTFQGQASWYPESGLVAANNDFPIGTELAVTNLANGKIVIVTVVSTGPYAPNRIIDLSDDAFQELAALSEGVIEVKVQPAIASPAAVSIDSPSGILIDAGSGQVLWEKNSAEVRSLASITKLMTALVFLETNTPFDKVVAMEQSDAVGGSSLRVSVGETLKVQDLFYSMLVGSANNASLALARSTGLGQEEFVSRMNAKAQSLGLTNTHFTDPSGIDPGNQSTAHGIALLSQEALKSFIMLQGTTTKEYTFTTISHGIFHRIKNTNELLDSSLYVTGGKTGYLDEAGYCLMTKARNSQGSEVIAVVLGAVTSSSRFSDTEKLLEWGLGIS